MASIAALAPIVAGCRSSSPTATTTGSETKPDITSSAFMFASCMRQHGIASFPDPHVTPGEHIVSMVVPASIGGSPQFQIAQNACAGILPTPGAVAQAANAQREAHKLGLLSFASCVRSHGVTGFPDPNDQGRLTPALLVAAGVDVHAPNVLAAARACMPASKGTVSAAAIRQAENSVP